MPRVSVVMTAYKDLRFLDQAVASVLAQDYRDFELIVVDDGSPDKSGFAGLEARDPRIRLITNAVNVGTAAAANIGIAQSSGEIVSRLDADDAYAPTRLSRLVAALDGDPALGLVGSAVSFIDENGNDAGMQIMPESDADIRYTILFHNPFYHSAVAFRRALFDAAGGYLEHELVSQDHYLWAELLKLGRGRNLREPLTIYRQNSQGLTVLNAQGRPRARTDKIRAQRWSEIGMRYSADDDALASDVSSFLRFHELPLERREAAYAEMLRVMDAFVRAKVADQTEAETIARALSVRMAAAPSPIEYSAWFAGKEMSTDWTSRFFETWGKILAARRYDALDVLEIGSWEGRSAVFFLNFLPRSRFVAVDTFLGSPEHATKEKWSAALPHIEARFDANVAAFSQRLEKVKLDSRAALARFAEEGRAFDVAFIDGSHHSEDVRADAEGVWPLMRQGGVVIFDDYEWTNMGSPVERPKLGIDAFLAARAGAYDELERGYQIIVRKR